MPVSCKECGRDLHVNPVEKPNVDWVKVVCSECGTMEEVSMVRLTATAKSE